MPSLCPAEGCGSEGECCRNHIYGLSLLLSTHDLPILLLLLRLGKVGAIKSDEFSEKFQRGGGSFSFQKNSIADFGNSKQGFFSMKLTQKSNFRV